VKAVLRTLKLSLLLALSPSSPLAYRQPDSNIVGSARNNGLRFTVSIENHVTKNSRLRNCSGETP